MMNRELIELQKGCKATCAVIKNEDCKELDSKIIIDANSSDSELLIFFKKDISDKEELEYLIIHGIDQLNKSSQDKYYQLVKDREFNGYKLPEDMVIVLTVKDKESLKNLSQELYNFCVVAF